MPSIEKHVEISKQRPGQFYREVHIRLPDNLENLDRQFEVYDALYAWCRLDVARNKT